MQLYTITDWLGLVPFGFVFGFAVLGLIQLIRRKSFLKVDFNILVLGGFYLIAFTVFMVGGRLISGVHWLTDIIGGILLSAGLVMLYYSVNSLQSNKD